MNHNFDIQTVAMKPPPPPAEATGVVPNSQRRRTLIEDPHGAAADSAESVVSNSLLQGALITCSGIAGWATYGIAAATPYAPPWIVAGAALLSVLLVLLAWRAGSQAAKATRRLTATGSEPRHAEVTASREAKRDLVVVRIAATLAPAYAVFGIAQLQPASVPLLSAAAVFGFAAITFAKRTAERIGNARYATRVIGYREGRAS